MKFPKDAIERIYYTKYYSRDTAIDTILAELDKVIDHSLELYTEPKVMADGNVLYGYCSMVVYPNGSDSLQPMEDS